MSSALTTQRTREGKGGIWSWVEMGSKSHGEDVEWALYFRETKLDTV